MPYYIALKFTAFWPKSNFGAILSKIGFCPNVYQFLVRFLASYGYLKVRPDTLVQTLTNIEKSSISVIIQFRSKSNFGQNPISVKIQFRSKSNFRQNPISVKIQFQSKSNFNHNPISAEIQLWRNFDIGQIQIWTKLW